MYKMISLIRLVCPSHDARVREGLVCQYELTAAENMLFASKQRPAHLV